MTEFHDRSMVASLRSPLFRYPSVGTMVLGDAGAADVQKGDYHTGACAFWEPGFFNYSWAGN